MSGPEGFSRAEPSHQRGRSGPRDNRGTRRRHVLSRVVLCRLHLFATPCGPSRPGAQGTGPRSRWDHSGPLVRDHRLPDDRGRSESTVQGILRHGDAPAAGDADQLGNRKGPRPARCGPRGGSLAKGPETGIRTRGSPHANRPAATSGAIQLVNRRIGRPRTAPRCGRSESGRWSLGGRRARESAANHGLASHDGARAGNRRIRFCRGQGRGPSDRDDPNPCGPRECLVAAGLFQGRQQGFEHFGGPLVHEPEVHEPLTLFASIGGVENRV